MISDTFLPILLNGFIFINAFISFAMLRELLSIADIRIQDRYAVFWSYLAIPVQYYLVYHSLYYQIFTFIPVILFLLLPIRSMLHVDCQGLIRSIATLQWFIMLSVFCLSHFAMILKWLTPALYGTIAYGLIGFFLLQIIAGELQLALYFRWKKKTFEQLELTEVMMLSVPLLILGLWVGHLTSLTLLQRAILALLLSWSTYFGKRNLYAVISDYKIAPSAIRLSRLISPFLYSSVVYFHVIFYWHGVV